MDWLGMLEPVVRDRNRRSPLYIRITERIRGSIEAGELGVDDRLPPDRELAKLLNLDRSTVARAYDQLEQDGFVTSQVGRGTFVKNTRAHQATDISLFVGGDEFISPEPAQSDALMSWDDKYSRASHSIATIVSRQLSHSNSAQGTIAFDAGSPTAEFFPHADFKDILNSLLVADSHAAMLGYSKPEGNPELIREVQAYLQKQGIKADLDEILILSGSQQGIDLVSRTLLNPDDVVLMEDPSYFWALCNFTGVGARTLPVPVDSDGMRLDSFEGLASRVGARLLYTMPSFQNPTGTTMPLARRKKLLELAARYQIPILEDNFVGDLTYDGHALGSLKSLDNHGCVIYQGTFSKALCPGLRLGWLVAPAPLMARLRLAKRTCDLSTNSMAQLILAEYLKRGLYEEHLSMVQEEYKKRRDTMCGAIDSLLSDSLTYHKPAGGMFLWAKLPLGYSARELLPYAEREGVTYSPGNLFYIAGSDSQHLRLTFIQQSCDLIEEGMKRLARSIGSYASNRRKTKIPGMHVAEATFI